MSSEISDNDPDVRVQLAGLSARQKALDQDLGDVRQAVVNLGTRIESLATTINAKLDDRFRPQWQTYIAGAIALGGFAAMFWTAGISPIKDTLSLHVIEMNEIKSSAREHDRADAAILERRNELFVTQREHIEFKLRMDERATRQRERIDRLDGKLDRLLQR